MAMHLDPCESCQVELSASLDHEADPARLPDALDHLASCAGCRRFWAGARALQDALPVARPGATRSRRPGRKHWTRWALAASILLALGFGWALRPDPGPGTRQLRVELGGAGTRMSDEQVVRMAVELLGASPDQRAALRRLLEEADRAPTPEASADELASLPGPGEGRPGRL